MDWDQENIEIFMVLNEVSLQFFAHFAYFLFCKKIAHLTHHY